MLLRKSMALSCLLLFFLPSVVRAIADGGCGCGCGSYKDRQIVHVVKTRTARQIRNYLENLVLIDEYNSGRWHNWKSESERQAWRESKITALVLGTKLREENKAKVCDRMPLLPFAVEAGNQDAIQFLTEYAEQHK